MKDYDRQCIWIIGASSGIGRALAHELHRRGASLILSARNESALRSLNEELGKFHQIVPLDVIDKESFASAFILPRRIDRIIYLAAVYEPGNIQDIQAQHVSEAIAINIEGAFTLLHHAIPFLKKQGGGQIALCGSIAGYRGLPSGQPYSATKAAIANLAESLRTEVAGDKIDVKLISPGFVKTPMTEKNDFPMPFVIEPQAAARHIANGLRKKRFEIHFPCRFTLLVKLLAHLPYRLFFPIAAKVKR